MPAIYTMILFAFAYAVNIQPVILPGHHSFNQKDTSELTHEDSIFNELHLGKLGLGRRAYDYRMLGYKVLLIV